MKNIFDNKIWNEKTYDKIPPIIVGIDDVFNSERTYDKYGSPLFRSNITEARPSRLRVSETWFKGFVTAIELTFSTPSLNVYKMTESDVHAY